MAGDRLSACFSNAGHLSVLLGAENRSVLAYDIVPSGEGPTVVTVASDASWSLVGVMGSTTLDPGAAIMLISQRGLDAAIRPLATAAAQSGAEGDGMRLRWAGRARSRDERMRARGALPLARGAFPLVGGRR